MYIIMFYNISKLLEVTMDKVCPHCFVGLQQLHISCFHAKLIHKLLPLKQQRTHTARIIKLVRKHLANGMAVVEARAKT